jgi:hypothetical protein
MLETLLDACVRRKKLWAFRPAYEAALTKLIANFDLEKDFSRLLFARYGVRDPWAAGGLDVTKILYVIVNGPLFNASRKNAELKRGEFYDNLQRQPARKTIPPAAA